MESAVPYSYTMKHGRAGTKRKGVFSNCSKGHNCKTLVRAQLGIYQKFPFQLFEISQYFPFNAVFEKRERVPRVFHTDNWRSRRILFSLL